MANDVQFEVANRASALLAKCDDPQIKPSELLHDLSDMWTFVHQSKNMLDYHKDLEAFVAVTLKVSRTIQDRQILSRGLSLSMADMSSFLHRYLTEDIPGSHEQAADGAWKDEHFNMHHWMKLGALFFEKTPRPVPITFLNGPLEQERRRIERRRRAIDDTGNQPQTRATQLNANDLKGDNEGNSAKMVMLVYQAYSNKPERDREEGIPFCRFFLDPDSYGQLIENLFYASFLIRDHRIQLFLRDGEPVVKMVDPDDIDDPDDEEEKEIHINHQILLLDYDTWEKLVAKYAITELYLGHRIYLGHPDE